MDESLKKYELMCIVSGQYTDDELSGIFDAIKKLLTNAGAEIISEDNLGRRRLSFPIKKMHDGVYFLVEANIPANKVFELTEKIKLQSEILRYMMVQKVESSKQAVARKPRFDRTESKPEEAAKKEEPKQEEKKTEEVPPEEKKTENIKIEEDSDKKRMEELDKKLDEILQEDIV